MRAQGFADRRDAGRQLARELERYRHEEPYVLGLPRGGVVVAAEVAERLNAPLDVVVARKIGAPSQPEFGVGAIAPNSVRFLDPRSLDLIGCSEMDLEDTIAKETAELQRRLEEYRIGRARLNLAGRTAIMVDDGLATGVTATAAARYVKSLHPARLVFATPAASSQGVDLVAREVDELVAIMTPPQFRSVGQWYADFEQTSDEEVKALLNTAAHRNGPKLI